MSVGLLAVRLLYRFYVLGHLSKWFTFLFNSVVVLLSCRLFTLAGNGLRIGDGGVFEKRQLNICTNAQ